MILDNFPRSPRSNYCVILRVFNWQGDMFLPLKSHRGGVTGQGGDLEGHHPRASGGVAERIRAGSE